MSHNVYGAFLSIFVYFSFFAMTNQIENLSSEMTNSFPNNILYATEIKPTPVQVPSHEAIIKLGVILPSLLILALAIVVILILFYLKFTDNPIIEKQPEEQANLILCNSDNAEFDYKVIFRVGSPTEKFDMKHGYVDFEILGPDDISLGPPVRFNCSLLASNGEMHYQFSRPTRIPSIVGIRASHGDQSGDIFFYDYILIDLNRDIVVEERKFNQYVSNRTLIYRGTIPADRDYDEDNLWTNMYIKLTCTEFLIFAVFIILAIGFMVMLVEYFNWHINNIHEEGSLFRSLMDVLLVSPIALIIFIAMVRFYKYTIKKNVIISEFFSRERKVLMWQIFRRIFIGFIILTGVVCAIAFIGLSSQFSFIKSLYCFCSMLIANICVLGSCILYESYLMMKNPSFDTIGHGYQVNDTGRNMSLRLLYEIRSKNIQGPKTTFFSNFSSDFAKSKSNSFSFPVGPKFANPCKNLMKKNKHPKFKNNRNNTTNASIKIKEITNNSNDLPKILGHKNSKKSRRYSK